MLHHTAGAEWESAWWTFANNTAYESIPGKPEKPGVSAHFIIDKDGTIYQCLPLTVRGRHAIGINWTSFGIEFVQEVVSGKDGHWMDRQILNRKKQVAAGLKLVRYLQDRFGIKDGDVIGHAMVNDSQLLQGVHGHQERRRRLVLVRGQGVPGAAVGLSSSARSRCAPPPAHRRS